MRYIAGIDIGNSSTEIALATLSATGELSFVSSALAETTGIKGTLRNVHGIQEALAQATKKVGINVSDISLIRINHDRSQPENSGRSGAGRRAHHHSTRVINTSGGHTLHPGGVIGI